MKECVPWIISEQVQRSTERQLPNSELKCKRRHLVGDVKVRNVITVIISRDCLRNYVDSDYGAIIYVKGKPDEIRDKCRAVLPDIYTYGCKD